ncbi:hypothetical protein [Priestia megaterium]|uniref:hypothetical protein n=1 Tax=Priestia megaterium TaxID=1404 RepID=UPI00207A499A|nr:hypothetical protein [Priestia megaterium]USL25100.1 hypothetical protein LIT33_02305 [Priestia megaterium]
MHKYIGPIIFISFLLFSIFAVFSAPIAKFLLGNYFSVTSNSDDWIGFSGNILGGILGGIFTLLGVVYAFGLEKKKSMREGIPDKILNLYLLKEELSKHQFTQGYNLSTTKQESIDNAKLLLEELKKFKEKKMELLENSAQVDTDIFTIIDNYYKSIRIIEFKINDILENKGSETQQSINIMISRSTQFHTFLVEKGIEKVEGKTTKYIEEFHKKKKSKKLLNELDNHNYLS